jgi:hypothetical protein
MAQTISIDMLTSEPGRQALRQADVIFAVDSTSRQGVIVYGIGALATALQTSCRPKLNLLEVVLNLDSQELDNLIAMVFSLRDHSDSL